MRQLLICRMISFLNWPVLSAYLVLAMATNENLPPNVIKQLAKELKNLDETPPEGIKVGVNDDDFSIIYADIEGPAGTPYENGIFRMKLILSHDFPHSPPKGYFLTKIFHPNIATNGEICVNALKRDWSPSLGLRHVLMVVRCLLIEPFPESALNEQAGKMLLDNYDEYAKHARLYTGIHALKPKPKVKAGAISESTAALNVDQTNASIPKSAGSGNPPQQPSPLAASLINMKGGNGLDQSAMPSGTTAEAAISSGSAAAPGAQKKETGLARVHADKKKIDARKKSLKRL
nr:ubiquitin-conjugating enzyme E2 22 [Ipomoea batatas]